MVKKRTNPLVKLLKKRKYCILFTTYHDRHNLSKEHIMTIRSRLKTILSLIPLWMQLALFTTVLTFIILFHLIYTDYQRNAGVIADTQTATSQRLLTLEMQNLEKYVQELSLFCIQSCYDQTFTNIIGKESMILPGETTYLKNQIRAYFYSRNDLKSYDLYLMNQTKCISYTQNGVSVSLFLPHSVKESDFYKECLGSPYFHAILPSDESDVAFSYAHSLLRIKTKQPLALVNAAVKNDYLNTLAVNHSIPGEFICLLNENGQLLYSGNPTVLSSDTPKLPAELSDGTFKESFRCTLGGQRYLVTCTSGENFHMRLFAFLPVSYIDAQITQIRSSILFSGLMLSIGVLLLITVLIRLLTNPLIILADKLVDVGNGDFTSTVNISGSREISHLSRSFNDMIRHIDRLIKKNYMAELNEKTARITALEAQLNPHFLYNTLQAVSTEALLNDQMKIYDMITSLASGLRYTIKGGDYVPLCQEMNYVENYIFLQKIRMEERLHITCNIAPETADFLIPKISIQTLVENSILHGIGPDQDSISIEVTAALSEDYLYITIQDDGCGIDTEHLNSIFDSFHQSTQPRNNIGLANLYSRLKLLYQEQADLKIETKKGSYTIITLIIPATKEAPHV